MLFYRLRMRIKGLITHVEHCTVTDNTQKGKLEVKLDSGKTKILKCENNSLLGIGVPGYVIYKRNRFIAFDRDFVYDRD